MANIVFNTRVFFTWDNCRTWDKLQKLNEKKKKKKRNMPAWSIFIISHFLISSLLLKLTYVTNFFITIMLIGIKAVLYIIVSWRWSQILRRSFEKRAQKTLRSICDYNLCYIDKNVCPCSLAAMCFHGLQ